MRCLSQKLWRVFIIVLAVCAVWAGAEETVKTQYEEDFSVFPNPEQGFYEHQALDHRLIYDLAIDPRRWKPGEPQVLQAVVPLTDTMTEGSYTVYLNLSDACPSLQGDPRYSFRCANTGIWDDQTGYNTLVEGVSVTGKLPRDTPKR